MQAIFGSLGIKNVLSQYPISINGNISDSSFENDNNLWILTVIEKYDGDETLDVYISNFVPLLYQIQRIC
jgi:hypothetical protein